MENKTSLIVLSFGWRTTVKVKDADGKDVLQEKKEYNQFPAFGDYEFYSIRYGGIELLARPEKEYVWKQLPDTASANKLETVLADECVRSAINAELSKRGFPLLEECLMPVKNEKQLQPLWMDEAYFTSISVWPQYRFNLGCGSGYVKTRCRIVKEY